MFRRFRPALLSLFLLWLFLLASFSPAFAQAPVHSVFTPSPAVPAPHNVFTPLLGPGNSLQVALLNAQIAGLNAKVAATAPTIYGQPYSNRFSDASPSGPHLFFPHYQTSGGDYGKSQDYTLTGFPNSPSVAQSTLDINEAAAQGADGFSLDLGSNTPDYNAAFDKILTAGDNWTTGHAGNPNAMGVSGFHSFITFDFSTFPQTTQAIEAVLTKAFTHSSYYKYQGKFFVSTYAGAGPYPFVITLWKQVIADMAAAGKPVYFVPGFEPTNSAGVSLSADVAGFTTQASGLLTQIPAQGAWDYGAALGIPLSASHTSLPRMDALAQVTKAFGLSYMGTVSPSYQGLEKPGRWYNEYNGPEVLDHTWQSILSYSSLGYSNAFWVQFVSWNDYGEYSRLTNADEGPNSPWPYLTHSSQADYYLSTLGLQALNRYYVQWYKTGVKPAFANDNLFLFYRTQPSALDVPGDEANKIGYVTREDTEGAGPGLGQDTFFIATGLPSAETLTIVNGGQTLTRTVPAGLYFTRLGPFVPGPVTAMLSRKGTATVTLAGHAIAASAAFYNWSQWSGYAHS